MTGKSVSDRIDELLMDAKPGLDLSSPGIERETVALGRTHAANATRLPRKRRLFGSNLGLGAGLIVLLVGGASASFAAPAVSNWLGMRFPDASTQHLSTGPAGEASTCDVQFLVQPDKGVRDDDPVVAAAKQYLNSLDLQAIKTDPNLYTENKDAWANVGATTEPGPGTAEVEAGAYSSTVSRLVFDEMTRQGFANSVKISSQLNCVPGAER